MPKTVGSIVLYNQEELHELTGATTEAWRRYLKSGRLKGNKIGGRWYVSEEALKEYMEGGGKQLQEAGKSS